MKIEYNDYTKIKGTLKLDSFAILLYCGRIYECEAEPFSTREWQELEKKIRASQLKSVSTLITSKAETLRIKLELEEEDINRILCFNKGLYFLFQQLQELEGMGMFVTTKYEDNYPDQLKRKKKKEMPAILYYCGNINNLSVPAIGVTGPKKTNKRIDNNTKEIITKLSGEGYALVCCGSRGVEKNASRQMLKNGGKTIQVTCGNYWNEIRENAKYLKNGQMLLVSANSPFEDFNLVDAIDRIQYAFCLTDYTIVMHSQINLGSIWMVAIQNFKEKWTKLVAVVDDEFHGNARLVESGAIGITMDMINSTLALTDIFEQGEIEIKKEKVVDQASIYDFLEDN